MQIIAEKVLKITTDSLFWEFKVGFLTWFPRTALLASLLIYVVWFSYVVLTWMFFLVYKWLIKVKCCEKDVVLDAYF